MDAHYRVAIFGSARIQEGDQIFTDVYTIAKGLAEAGFDVVTGGGPGIMQAANAGHKSASRGTHSIGLNIKLPLEQGANSFLDINRQFNRFSDRLDTFVSLSDAAVVATGGIGTLLEFFYTWQLAQVEHLCETPIILFGEMWGPLMDWLRAEVLGRELIDKDDLHQIFHIGSAEKVIRFIRTIHDDRATMEHICANYDKYRAELS